MVEEAKLICEIGRRMYNRGLVASHDGNISLRLSDGNIMITPTLTGKGFMNENDMVIVDIEGKIISGTKKPSSEMLMHLTVYKKRGDVNGIVHAHPIMASAFAVIGRSVDMKYMPEAIKSLGEIHVAPYAEPGTDEVSKSITPFINGYNGALLANHGAITWAKDLTSAYYLMEQLEFYCNVVTVAEKIGKPNII